MRRRFLYGPEYPFFTQENLKVIGLIGYKTLNCFFSRDVATPEFQCLFLSVRFPCSLKSQFRTNRNPARGKAISGLGAMV